jgi:hypothetical protein
MPTRPLPYRPKHGDDFEKWAIFDAPAPIYQPSATSETAIPTLLLGSGCMVSLSG